MVSEFGDLSRGCSVVEGGRSVSAYIACCLPNGAARRKVSLWRSVRLGDAEQSVLRRVGRTG